MPEENPESAAEAAKFLERDFNQCFQQLRHYDAQILEICKFAVTAYTAVIGASLALYKYGIDKDIEYTVPSVGILSAGLLLGLCLTALVARNRAYFVFVARYINEQRGFFLAKRPLGFENRTRMYTNPAFPPFFNWRSSQTLLLFVLSGLNSFLAGSIVFLLRSPGKWFWVLGGAGICWLVQVVLSVGYLKSREHKSAERAISGRE